MLRRYGSFLIRYWRLGNGERRIEVEHIPSGARERVTSSTAAFDWIESRVGDATETAIDKEE